MNEKPILMSAPMVLSALRDDKTNTRRIVKPQPQFCGDFLGDKLWQWNPRATMSLTANELCAPDLWIPFCPYGKIGDRLWVRETFARNPYWEEGDDPDETPQFFYRCDMPDQPTDGVWTPSIHMPRIASRLTLEITNVRVERLQDISEKDARAEGVERNVLPSMADTWKPEDGYLQYPLAQHREDFPAQTARESFQSLWGYINGADSWATNPWVWVIAFRRLEAKRAV